MSHITPTTPTINFSDADATIVPERHFEKLLLNSLEYVQHEFSRSLYDLLSVGDASTQQKEAFCAAAAAPPPVSALVQLPSFSAIMNRTSQSRITVLNTVVVRLYRNPTAWSTVPIALSDESLLAWFFDATDRNTLVVRFTMRVEGPKVVSAFFEGQSFCLVSLPRSQSNDDDVHVDVCLARSNIRNQHVELIVQLEDHTSQRVTLLDDVSSMTNKGAQKGGKTYPRSVALHNSLLDPVRRHRSSKAGLASVKKKKV